MRRLLLPFHHSHRNVQILISRRVATLDRTIRKIRRLFYLLVAKAATRGEVMPSAPPSGMSRWRFGRKALKIAGELPTAGHHGRACKRTR